MNYFKYISAMFGVCALLFLFFPCPAHASSIVQDISRAACTFYIDPGTGSILIQFLIGAAVTGAGMIGIFWKKVKTSVINLFTRQRGNEDSR